MLGTWGKKGELACSPRGTFGGKSPQKLFPEGFHRSLRLLHKPIQEFRPGEAPLVSQGDGAAEAPLQSEGDNGEGEHPLCLPVTANAAQNPQKEPCNLLSDTFEATRERN